MRTSWADSVANAESSGATGASNDSRLARASYVPPHLRNRQASADAAPAPSQSDGPQPAAYSGPPSGNRWGGGSFDSGSGGGGLSRPGFGGGRGGGWNNRTGGWDRGKEREVNPFANDEETPDPSFDQENTGINFDAYEDIPVETSGDNVPPPVNTFADIDLGEALNANIKRCKYVKPTPVQRHAIPISLVGRDLMACAQTGSGKTAAFCFPIISGIMKGQMAQRPRGSRTVYPLALILSPTRELSVQVSEAFEVFIFALTLIVLMFIFYSFGMQIHEEARKFAYQTGVRVVVAYGGAPINQQVSFKSICFFLTAFFKGVFSWLLLIFIIMLYVIYPVVYFGFCVGFGNS